jgi:uncharacterized integral membrane protein
MNQLFLVIVSSLAALWIAAIAILSVQNATAVSLQFLAFRSVPMPIGVVLAFSAALGMVGGAVSQVILFSSRRNTSNLPADESQDEIGF